jgi:predicted transcriptional regulator
MEPTSTKLLHAKGIIRRSRIRDRIEIICQILQIANGGMIRKIKIMYKANLSYAQLKVYTIILTERDLLRYDLDTQTFKTTEKGLSLLEVYNQMNYTMMEKQI